MSVLLSVLLAALGAQAKQADGPHRPQLPARPLSYDELAVTIFATPRSEELAGTLTRPRIEGTVPAVILVQGGSPFDRDGTFAGHQPLFVLSDALTRAGVATLRLDDRGVGGSAGAKLSATLEELAGDLEECVRFLREQPGIRADAVGLVGHSGGALLCALVASRDPEIASVVLLGCPALPLPTLIAAQMAAEGDGSLEIGARLGGAAAELVREIADSGGAPFEDSDAVALTIELVHRRWQELVAAMPEPARHEGELFIASMSRKLPIFLGSAYLRDVFCLDPGPMIRQIRCPVLALWGEYDQGRKLANASAWEMTRNLADGACSSFQIAQVQRTNHFLQTCQTGALDEFARIEETVSPEVLRLVVEWSGRWTSAAK